MLVSPNDFMCEIVKIMLCFIYDFDYLDISTCVLTESRFKNLFEGLKQAHAGFIPKISAAVAKQLWQNK